MSINLPEKYVPRRNPKGDMLSGNERLVTYQRWTSRGLAGVSFGGTYIELDGASITIRGAGADAGIVKIRAGLDDYTGIDIDEYTTTLKCYCPFGIGIPQLSADPGTGAWGADEKGFMWFNTTSNVMKYWDGSAVKTITAT